MKIRRIEPEPFHSIDYWNSVRPGCPEKRRLGFFKAGVEGLPAGVDAVVAAADLQGRESLGGRLLGEAVADELAGLVAAGRVPPPAAVLLGGDLYDYPDCARRGGTGNVGPVWRAFADRFPRVLGVHGNHDMLDEALLPPNARALDGDLAELGGLRIGGVSGIIGRPTKNQRRAMQDHLALLELVLQEKPDLLLLHAGPDDPATGRIGDPAIREVLEGLGEALVVFGHCHWPDPLAEAGRNQLLNVDGRVVVLGRA